MEIILYNLSVRNSPIASSIWHKDIGDIMSLKRAIFKEKKKKKMSVSIQQLSIRIKYPVVTIWVSKKKGNSTAVYNSTFIQGHLKRPWCWERLKAGGEGDHRGWDGWMASPTQWTLVWVNSGSWWWTGRLAAAVHGVTENRTWLSN